MYSSSFNVFFRNTSKKVSKRKNVNYTMMVPQGLATRIGVNLDFLVHKRNPHLYLDLCTRRLGLRLVGNISGIGF